MKARLLHIGEFPNHVDYPKKYINKIIAKIRNSMHILLLMASFELIFSIDQAFLYANV